MMILRFQFNQLFIIADIWFVMIKNKLNVTNKRFPITVPQVSLNSWQKPKFLEHLWKILVYWWKSLLQSWHYVAIVPLALEKLENQNQVFQEVFPQQKFQFSWFSHHWNEVAFLQLLFHFAMVLLLAQSWLWHLWIWKVLVICLLVYCICFHNTDWYIYFWHLD